MNRKQTCEYTYKKKNIKYYQYIIVSYIIYNFRKLHPYLKKSKQPLYNLGQFNKLYAK